MGARSTLFRLRVGQFGDHCFKESFYLIPPSGICAPPIAQRLWEKGIYQLVSRDIVISSAWTDTHLYSSIPRNIPDAITNYDLAASLRQLQPSHHLRTAYVGQPPALPPYSSNSVSPSNWQQGTSLLPISPGPSSQSQEQSGLGLSDPSLPMNLSFGPPPEVAMTSLLCEPVGESESLATNTPAR